MASENFIKAQSNNIRENLERILPNLKGVTFLPVTKTVPVSVMKEARDILLEKNLPVLFGENYAQELLSKRIEFPQAQFHFIGRLQSNKIKSLLEARVFIQSIGSEKHLDIAKKVALDLGIDVDVYLQVNVSEDPNKSGVKIDEAKMLLDKQYNPVNITGLMTILENTTEEITIRESYRKLAKLAQGKLELSMGMSGDYKIAIEEGASMVRLGSVLFGERA